MEDGEWIVLVAADKLYAYTLAPAALPPADATLTRAEP